MDMETGDSAKPAFWLRPATVAAFVIVVAAVKLLLAASTDLVRDEAYYWYWAQHPSIGYLDHAPLVAWIIAVTTTVFGDTELGVRVFGVLTIVPISAAMWRISRLLFGDTRPGALAIYWYNLSLGAALLLLAMTPDPPSTLFWTLTVWAMAEFAASRNPNWWLAVGLFAGLGLLSKYTNLFLGAGIALWLITSRERWIWLRHWQVWAGGALALLLFAPVVAWNAERDWASFRMQGGRSLGQHADRFGFFPHFGEFIAGQALLYMPFLLLLTIAGIVLFLARGKAGGSKGLSLPVVTSLPLSAYMLYHLTHSRVEANWTMPVWPLLALVGAWAAVMWRPRRAALAAAKRWAVVLNAPLALLISGVIYFQAAFQPFALGILDRTNEMHGWVEFQANISRLAETAGAGWIAVPEDYGLTAMLIFYGHKARDPLFVHQVDERNRYEFLPEVPEAKVSGRTLLVVPSWTGEVPNAPLGRFESGKFLQLMPRLAGGEPALWYGVWLVEAAPGTVPR